MREAKRVLLAPKVWGLLALLLAIELVLLVGQDVHTDGFYDAYREALPEFAAMPLAEAEAAAERELTELRSVGRLRLWQSELDEFTRESLREECAEAFGENFEERLAAGEFDLSEAALEENYLRREVLNALLTQLAHLREYPEYLAQVQKNVTQMKALSIFNRENSFTLRNIEKTGRDFPREVELRLDNDFALTTLVTDRLGGYCLLVFTLIFPLLLTEERKRGLWSLIHGAPQGRGRLALRRAGLLLLGAVLGTAVLLGGELIFCAQRFGGLGSLTRNVQSVEAFSDFPWVMPVWKALLAYFVLKIVGMWLVGLAVWAILQAVNHLPLAIAAAGVALAAEYSLYCFLPDSFAIVFLRYVNLFALVDVPTVALHYLNLNLFGMPVQGFLLSVGLTLPVAGALLALNILLAQRKKPVTRQNALLSLFDRIRVPCSRAVGRLHLFGLELYKVLWQQRGLAVLLGVALFAFAVLEEPYPDSQLYDTELAALSASMQGEITTETLAQIDELTEKYSAWTPSEEVLKQLDILARLRETVVESLEAEDGRWLIDPRPFAALMGCNINRYQRQNATVLLLALVLLLSGVFAHEPQNRMTQLLRGSPDGRAALWRKKTAVTVILTFITWVIFEAGELCLLAQSYDAVAYAAPLQSFDAFADLPYRVSLGVGVAGYLVLRLVAMLAAAGVISLISCLSRQTNTAILLGCAVLVLPACLSYMGITALEPLSFVVLFSPMEAESYLAAVLVAVACCAATFVLWNRGKRVKA